MTIAIHPRPAPAEPLPWTFPAFERYTLANGVNVIACHLADRPIVEVRLVLPGCGPRHDGSGLEGSALITARALSEGTERLEAEQFNDAVESLGARFNGGLDWNAGLCNMSVPVSRLTSALELMAEAVTTPGFREDDIARLVRRRVDEIATSRAYPQSRASEAFSAATFDARSRMSLPVGGTDQSISALDVAGVRSFWAQGAVPMGSTLVVVGDLREIALAPLLDRTIGAWQTAATGMGEPDAEEPANNGWAVADFPDAVQTHLNMGFAGPPIPIDERAALRTAVHVLGGYFSSRLMATLREEKGITYGVNASLDHRLVTTIFSISTSVQRDATIEAVVETLAEVRRVSATLEHDEVARAIDHLVRTAPIGYKSTGNVAHALVRLATEHLPDDYHDRLRAATAAVTPTEAGAAFDRWINPDKLVVVAAGPAAAIAEPLGDLAGDAQVLVL